MITEDITRVRVSAREIFSVSIACECYNELLKHDGTVPTCFNQSKSSISFVISHKVSYMRVQMLKHGYKR